jgi:hypothetical protein
MVRCGENMADQQHMSPGSNRDYDFFYEGLEQGRLLIQQCAKCNLLRHPPGPMCPHCHSLDKTAREMSGRGTVYSFVVHRYPPLPGFDMPHPVAVVELEEGVRVVAGMDGTPIERIEIGMPVVADFHRRGQVATLRFGPTATTGEG